VQHPAACRCQTCQPQYLKQQLDGAGERWTAQRQAVWDALAAARSGSGALELAQALVVQGVGQATVYRSLELLERCGLARRAALGGGRQGYVPVQPGHHHALICDGCGQVQDFAACSWNVVGELLALRTGFTVHSHYLEVHGLCPACQTTK
jgi:Fe2+ or Zn2+ uptake regulation protein